MAMPAETSLCIRDAIVEHLREEHPYMRIQSVHAMADDCKDMIEKRIALERPVMEAAKARASIFMLPPELRVRIYEHVVIAHRGEYCDRPGHIKIEGIRGPAGRSYAGSAHSDSDSEYEWNWRSTDQDVEAEGPDWRRQSTITRVSRQIRAETLPIYYGANVFEFDANYMVLPRIHHKWVPTL